MEPRKAVELKLEKQPPPNIQFPIPNRPHDFNLYNIRHREPIDQDMSSEDFSFPTENLFSNIDSPPLWHSSPAASASGSDSSGEKTEKNGKQVIVNPASTPIKVNQTRCLSCIEKGQKTGKKVVGEREDEDEEEKMDLLWENFNEELPRSRSSRAENSDKSLMTELGCLSRTNRSSPLSARNNKPTVVVVFKVLKRFFLLQNSHQHKHKSLAW